MLDISCSFSIQTFIRQLSIGVDKNPYTDSNQTIRIEKWLSGWVAADCQSHIFGFRWVEMSVFDFQKSTQQYPNLPELHKS
jgi:hypothetical protein